MSAAQRSSFKNLSELPTPCLIVDVEAMRRNMLRMQRFLDSRQKRLRPHAKTHKSTAIARLQLDHGATGICAAKLSEVEKLIAAGLRGILLTGPVVTEEGHERLIRCLEQAPDLLITIENLDVARRLSRRLSTARRTVRCLIDLDPKFNRTGVPFEEALEFGKALARIPHLEICGIQSYAGNLQHIISQRERAEQSRQVMQTAAEIMTEYRGAGLRMDIFSGGGTGTVATDAKLAAMTEIQAGSYLFMDTEYAAIEWTEAGGPETFETALFVLTTVISANHSSFVTVDAGLKALYKDGGTPAAILPGGAVLSYAWFGDEYGKVMLDSNAAKPVVGTQMKLKIPHVDPTVNLFDTIYGVTNGQVVEIFPIDLKGCSQ